MTQRQKTIGVTAAAVVSVLTFTTYNPMSGRLFSSSNTGRVTNARAVQQQPDVKIDTLLAKQTTTHQYTPGYANPIEE